MSEQPVLLVLALTALLLALIALVIVGQSRAALKREQQARSDALESVRDELRALASSAVGVGRKLSLLEKQLHALRSAPAPVPVVSAPEPEAPPRSEKPYQMAARLMQRGADVDELMSVCELTRGEAELLASLYRQAPTSRTL